MSTTVRRAPARLHAAVALALAALAALACGGSDKPTGETEADVEKMRQACAAAKPDASSCAELCKRGREAGCETLKNACLIGADGSACFLLGQAYAREGDNVHARGAFKLACSGGQSAACEELGGSDTEIDSTPDPAPAPAPSPPAPAPAPAPDPKK